MFNIFRKVIPTRFMDTDPTGGGVPPKDDSTSKKDVGGVKFTQEELDKAIKDRLERERKKYADYEELKKAKEELNALKTSQMSDAEKSKAELAAATKRADEAEAREKVLTATALRGKLLVDAGLPSSLADRVRGDTEEEIKKDIEALKPLVKASPVGGSGTPPGNNSGKDGDFGRGLAKQFGRNHSKDSGNGFFKMK